MSTRKRLNTNTNGAKNKKKLKMQCSERDVDDNKSNYNLSEDDSTSDVSAEVQSLFVTAGTTSMSPAWFWEYDDGQDVWVQYDEYCETLLEEAYEAYVLNKRRCKLDMTSQNKVFEWMIDFNKMTQTNKTTNTKRLIKRELVPTPASLIGRVGSQSQSKAFVETSTQPSITQAVPIMSSSTTRTASISSSTKSSSISTSSNTFTASTTTTSTTFNGTSSSGTPKVTYLECKEGSSHKFYELSLSTCGTEVTIRYGRIEAYPGVVFTKSFKDEAESIKFIDKTASEKVKKGYSKKANTMATSGNRSANAAAGVSTSSSTTTYTISSTANANANAPSIINANPKADLENGLKVFVQGSSKQPYLLKKFNGGYSCSCQGFIMQIKSKGIQATTCKHLKEVRGEQAENDRCQSSSGVPKAALANDGKKRTDIPSKISLAKSWTASTDPTGYIMSEKLDGMRAYWDGRALYSRSGLPIANPDWFVAGLPADLDLDGELFLGRKRFDDCMSITRRTDAGDEWKSITFVVFDAPTVSGGILKRLQAATNALKVTSPKYCAVHPHEECLGIEHLQAELLRIETLGGEGLMLRAASSSHRGGRTSDLLKVKTFSDDEALVLDYEDGKGKHTGSVGALCCMLRSGARFKVGSGFTDVQRLYANAPKVGSVITFKYFELSGDGIPRFPTFLRSRPDVSVSEFPSA